MVVAISGKSMRWHLRDVKEKIKQQVTRRELEKKRGKIFQDV